MTTTAPAFGEILPEGLSYPEDVPPEIFERALAIFLSERRLDMRALASDLGISRATLYRRVSGRDHLLGQVIWFLTRAALVRSLEGAQRMRGHRRIVEVVDAFMHDVHARPALRRFLEAEPEAALRILTSKHGPIQQGIIDALERALQQELDRGTMRLSLEPATLAYAIVRLGEAFLYADVIADNEPDVERAVEVIARLLRER